MSRRLIGVVVVLLVGVGLVVEWKAIWNGVRHALNQPIYVNSTDDYVSVCPFVCTLRSAVIDALSGDRINFTVTGTITMQMVNEFVLNQDVTITGPGASLLAIDRNKRATAGIFVNDTKSATIADLTLRNSSSGGVNNLSGKLTLVRLVISNNEFETAAITNSFAGEMVIDNCVIADNKSSRGSPAIEDGGGTLTITNSSVTNNQGIQASSSGMGIESHGTLIMTNTTIANNKAEGADSFGGGLQLSGKATITNSTIVGNSAGIGGGIWSDGASVAILYSTITGNSATQYAGGIFADAGGTVTLGSTILAGNTAPKNPDASGVFKSQGFNLIGKVDTASGFVDSDQLNVDPLLDTLAVNAPGTMLTMAPNAGSPAIGKGGSNCPATDQRGIPRKQNCDVGAYETAAQ